MRPPSRSSASAALQEQEQIVEVDLAFGPLAGDVGPEEGSDGLGMGLAPGIVGRQHLTEAMAGVDAPRVHLDQRRRPGHAHRAGAESVLVPQQVHDIGGVGGIEQGESRRQPERLREARDELMGDGVERAAAEPSSALAAAAQRSCSGEHVVGRPPREGQQQDPLRRHAALEQSRHPGGQRACLSGPGAGHDHERSVPVNDGGELGFVEVGIPRPGIEHLFDVSASCSSLR